MKTLETIRQGGKRIFEDLKLPDAEELNVKAQIAYRICGLIQKRVSIVPKSTEWCRFENQCFALSFWGVFFRDERQGFLRLRRET
jgi:hypothetical protein